MKIADLDPLEIEAAWPLMTPEERAQVERLLKDVIPDDLASFFLAANPEFKHPEHLWRLGIDKEGQPARSLGETLASTIDSPQQASFSTPPQFGKSVLLLAAMLWYGWRRPGSISAYCSYNLPITLEQSEKCRKMASLVGLRPTGPKSRIQLANGSVIHFVSIDGPLEGIGVTGILAVDDMYKSRQDAESIAVRKQVSEWFTSTAIGRRHKTTSIILIAHRWTADDLIEELVPKGWDWTNYPAILPDGTSLWEDLKPLEMMQATRDVIGTFKWESEYQGKPTARGGRLFEGLVHYLPSELPPKLNRGIGLDLAYSEKTSADWSIALALGEYDAAWYVLDVIRRQVRPEKFAEELGGWRTKYAGAPWRWDGSTTEKGTGALITHFVKIPLQVALAKGHAYDRAQLVSAAWRRGAVKVPAVAYQTKDMADCIAALTSYLGGADEQDDDVAALASAFELLPPKVIPKFHPEGSPGWVNQKQMEMQEQALKGVRQKLHNLKQPKDWRGQRR